MLGQYIIALREGLEAALVTGIILAFLVKTSKRDFTRYIWVGVGTAVIVSGVVAIFIWVIYGDVSEKGAMLFEGIAALLAVVVITSMILWMALKGGRLNQEMEVKVKVALQKGTMMTLIGLGFVVVFREGFESVLFLVPFAVTDFIGTLVGALLGIGTSVVFAFLIFKVGARINLRRFFYLSSLLLILLAAGLAGYGVHELIEYQEVQGVDLGWVSLDAFNLGIPQDSVFHDEGIVGSVFAVMFGYAVEMEWARVLVHIAYLIIFIPFTVLVYEKPEMFCGLTKKKR